MPPLPATRMSRRAPPKSKAYRLQALIKAAIKQNSRYLVMVLLLLLVVAAFYFFRAVMLPFAVSALFAYLIAPVINRIAATRVANRTLHRGFAILIVYAIATGGLVLGGFYFVPKLTSEVNRLVKDLPVILHEMEQNWVVPLDRKVNVWLSGFFPLPIAEEIEVGGGGADAPNGAEAQVPPEPTEKDVVVRLVEDYTYIVQRVDDNRFEVIPKRRSTSQKREQKKNWDFNRQISHGFGQFRTHFENNILELLQVSRKYVQSVVGSLFTTFVVLMVSAFILVDPRRIHQFMCSCVPAHRQATFEALIARLDRGLAGGVRGQLLICLLTGSLTGIGIAVIGVPFVFTLTLIATLFSLIPIFGVLISTLPIMLMALTVSLSTAGLAVGWILVVHFFEGNFLNPKIMGDSSHIHPVLIVFALVAGEYVGGILGALLAVPIFSLVQNSFLFLKALAEEVETAK